MKQDLTETPHDAGDAMPLEPLLTVKEVADWLGVTTTWVYDQTRAGTLRVIVLGKKDYRWDPADIRAYLARSIETTVRS